MSTLKNTLIVGIFLLPCSVLSFEISDERTKSLLDSLQTNIETTLYSIAQIEQQHGVKMSDFQYEISAPDSKRANLGLVLDMANFNNGLMVLAVTPESAAWEAGIRAGDNLKAINRSPISETNAAQIMDSIRNSGKGEQIEFSIERNNRSLTKVATLEILHSPSFRLEIGDSNLIKEVNKETTAGCGNVSIFLQPPSTKDVYPVIINRIDDETSLFKHTYKVPTGERVINVSEQIGAREIKRRRKSIRAYKSKDFALNVEANTRYYIGAKFIRDKRNNIKSGEYWEPVVWKKTTFYCNS